MWMSEKDFRLLLARNPALKVHQTYYKKERAPNAKVSAPSEFDSEAERRYYYKVIYPAIWDGTISKVSMHKKFELLPSAENNGKNIGQSIIPLTFLWNIETAGQRLLRLRGGRSGSCVLIIQSGGYFLLRIFVTRMNGALWRCLMMKYDLGEF